MSRKKLTEKQKRTIAKYKDFGKPNPKKEDELIQSIKSLVTENFEYWTVKP